MKAVMASAVVIVLALAAVSGVTYSWWSDTEDAEIQIQTGMLDVSVSNFSYSSIGGGTLVIEEGTQLTGNSKAIDLNILNAAPGDVYTAEYNIEFKSTVNAKYIVDAESNVDWISVELTSDSSISDMSDWETLPQSSSNNDYEYYLSGKITVTFILSEDTPMNSKGTVVINNRITQSANDEQYWNGLSAPKFPDSSVDEDNRTLKIGSAAELALFRDNVNDGVNKYSGWIVSLISDIDLNNINWTPIGPNADSGNKFDGTFDGQGYTIYNLNVNPEPGYTAAGLFGALNGTAKNFTISNANVSHTSTGSATDNGIAVVAGSLYNSGHIDNVSVNNATVQGNRYVGGISGYVYGNITNCIVTNVELSANPNLVDESEYNNGDKVGGIAGYWVSEGIYQISGNKVTDVKIEAYRDAGCIVGAANGADNVSNNTIDGVNTITIDQINCHYEDKDANAGEIVGRILNGTLPDSNIKAENCEVQIVVKKKASDSASLSQVISSGGNDILLSEGTFIIPDTAKGKTLKFTGSKSGETIVATQDDGSYEGCDYSLDGATAIFENIVINTDSSTYTGYARLNATYNNCTINGTYTLYGNSTFNNCTFNVSGDVYNIWTWGAPEAKFNNCIFNNDGKAMLLYGTVDTKLTLNGCIFNDKGGLPDLKAAVEIGDDYGKSYELIINKATVNGYEINDKGINTGTTLWGNKNSMGTDKLNVIVNGVDVY